MESLRRASKPQNEGKMEDEVYIAHDESDEYDVGNGVNVEGEAVGEDVSFTAQELEDAEPVSSPEEIDSIDEAIVYLYHNSEDAKEIIDKAIDNTTNGELVYQNVRFGGDQTGEAVVGRDGEGSVDLETDEISIDLSKVGGDPEKLLSTVLHETMHVAGADHGENVEGVEGKLGDSGEDGVEEKIVSEMLEG
jgi:hypothetical protein